MRSVMIIPARLGSTRLPRKLLLDETGLPLICHTVKTAVQAVKQSDGLFSEVIVATDHDEILQAVNAFSSENALPARAEMTSDKHQSGSDRIAEVVERMTDKADIIVNLQGDEPEMPTTEIVNLAKALAEDKTGADIATLVYPITDRDTFLNPNTVKAVAGINGEALYFSRAPIPYDRDTENASADGVFGLHHLGIYAYRRESLMKFVSLPAGKLEQTEKLEQLRALENGMKIIIRSTESAPPKGIDTEEDYKAFVSRCP